MFQYAENPLAYTRLHCYLPWIAEQYGLDFDYAGVPEDDPTCSNGFVNWIRAFRVANQNRNGAQCGGLSMRCHRATVYRDIKI